MRIITVSRQFGSGGRELGKRLADALGFAYYDKEIIRAVAERADVQEDYAEKVLTNGSFMAFSLTFARSFTAPSYSPIETSGLLATQHGILKELAEKGDCVIVGRSANVILANETPFRIFVYATMVSRIERCRGRAEGDELELSDRAYEKKIRAIDKKRASFHSLVSQYKWGDPLGYDLCLNTTGVEIKSVVNQTAEFAKHFFDNNGK